MSCFRFQIGWLAWAALPVACAESGEARRDASQPGADAAVELSGADAAEAGPLQLDRDCDPEDPQRGPDFYERFGDDRDSNCDGRDDPVIASEPCSCDWLEPSGMPEVSRCGQGFDPPAAQAAVTATEPGAARCATLPDLALTFVVQCLSSCAGVPIYFSVANLGGVRSAPAHVRLEGDFQRRAPETPLEIEPLEPGQHTALIDVHVPGDYRIVVETSGEQCSVENDAVAVNAYDLHCGFF